MFLLVLISPRLAYLVSRVYEGEVEGNSLHSMAKSNVRPQYKSVIISIHNTFKWGQFLISKDSLCNIVIDSKLLYLSWDVTT